MTLDERLLHVADAKQNLQTRFHWLCDSMENDLKHALGDRPNSEFIFDPDGKVVVARQWSNADALREDLTRLIGPVRRPTSIADLGMKPLAPPKTAPKGIVPRLQVPSGLSPVLAEPISSETKEPFYVKLRAEVEPSYATTGYGRLYLGFFLDQIYKVHWNNKAMPVTWEIESTTGVTVTGRSGQGPEVKAPADADPREFLVDLCCEDDDPRGQEIVVKLKYLACDDAETFCKPVTQFYKITLTRDRDGGSRRSMRSRGSGGQRRNRSQMLGRPGSGQGRSMGPGQRNPSQIRRRMQR